jgi:signal transduction histidine kinase
MIEPPLPANETERLAALRALRLLDTPAEERFDRITRTARDLFGVPIALISLVDAGRQWFKSRQGLAATETPRAISFCGHAILGDAAFVVSDARNDERFADNPLVTGAPHIRFYAGMPLNSTDGRKIGTLCLIDSQPRAFDAGDEQRLRDLAAWAEREANLTNEMANHLDAMRETFVRLVSHELRTPVTSIVGALEILRSGIASGQDIDTLTRIAIDGADQINRVVDDIVVIAETDAGQLDLTPSRIDLDLFIQAALDAFDSAARQGGIHLVLNNPDKPEVLAAPKLLVRILRTLIDNALRFAPTDSTVTVGVAMAADGHLRISVTDRGPGIPAPDLPRLFQPFTQGKDADNRHHNGCGVGLATSHQLAIAMGGRLGYTDAAGGGSCFFLDLPVTDQPASVG